MPLFTDDIEQARIAYGVLEGRARSAEQLVGTLQTALDDLKAAQPLSFELAQAIRQRALDREAENVKLQTQVGQAVEVKADIPLQNFLASLGLAAALGESTMPDRTIPSISAILQTHITVAGAVVGLRFFQPGVGGDPASLTSTSFEIAKVPPQPGALAPRNLYTVLQDKQSLYTDPFWNQFTATTPPPSTPSADLVGTVATILANTGSWSFAFLLQSAVSIAGLEKNLSSLVAAALPGDSAAAFGAAADSALALTRALGNKNMPVAGDLFALTTSLDNTTNAARTLLP